MFSDHTAYSAVAPWDQSRDIAEVLKTILFIMDALKPNAFGLVANDELPGLGPTV